MKFPRLSITDKFLWDLYNTIEKMDNIINFPAARPWREVWCLELHRAQRAFEKRKSRYNFSQFVNYLKKKGYIKVKNLEPKSGAILTQKGMEKG